MTVRVTQPSWDGIIRDNTFTYYDVRWDPFFKVKGRKIGAVRINLENNKYYTLVNLINPQEVVHLLKNNSGNIWLTPEYWEKDNEGLTAAFVESFKNAISIQDYTDYLENCSWIKDKKAIMQALHEKDINKLILIAPIIRKPTKISKKQFFTFLLQ